MNELIEKLATDAGLLNYVDNETPRHYFIDGHADLEEVEKFAQLIIQKCDELNKKQSYELLGVIHDVEEGDGFDDICLDTVKRVATYLNTDLKEHFGVEE